MLNLSYLRRFAAAINGTSVLLLLLASLTTPPAFCDNKTAAGIQSDVNSQTPAHATQTTGGAGLQAFIDPNTGKLRAPTDEQLRQPDQSQQSRAQRTLPNATKRSIPAPVQKQLPSGAISVEVGEHGKSYAVAKRNPDGSISTQCDTGSKSAQEALSKIQQSDTTEHQESNHDR